MYALRGTRASVAALADCDDTTTWGAQVAYGTSEGTYMLLVGPKGDTIDNAITTKRSAGVDSQFAKVILGDWPMWNDTVNGQSSRIVTPQGFFAGKLGALSPHISPLNKPMIGIVGTQRNSLGVGYSDADLEALGLAGIDVITNPVPGGFYYGARFGRNSSSDPTIRTDTHTRMTNFIAVTLDNGIGKFVGENNTPQTRRQCQGALDGFFHEMFRSEMIEDWQVICNEVNNPPERRQRGFLRADIKVRYFSVIEYLIASLEGGQTVTITRVSAIDASGASGAAGAVAAQAAGFLG
jgi:hypothetical protein